MKIYKLGDDNPIIIQVPDDVNIDRNKAFAIALDELQEQIASGVVEINQRKYPCLFCYKSYDEQHKLLKHMGTQSHVDKVKIFKKINDIERKDPNDNEQN